MTLTDFFAQNPSGALALSGGVDSAYLAWAAGQYGKSWRAYYVKAAFQPAFELRDAGRVAAYAGIPLSVIEADVLAVPEIAANPENRCYFCKRMIFSTILEHAAADGCTLVIDGTNASDDVADRPGMRALRKLGPLAAAGVRPDQSGRARALEGGGPFHMGQAVLRLSRHAHPGGHGDHGRSAHENRARRGRAFCSRLHGFPHPSAREYRAAAIQRHPARRRADAPGGAFGAADAAVSHRRGRFAAAAGIGLRRSKWTLKKTYWPCCAASRRAK